MGLSRASVLLPGPLQNSVSKLLRRLRRQGGVGPYIHSTEREVYFPETPLLRRYRQLRASEGDSGAAAGAD